MITNKTVVICCAGMGKRLGISVPKALLNINGKPLIIRLLESLNEIKDIRIVVGFEYEKVIETVLKFRKDITFVINHNYRNTGPATSLNLALDGANEYILSIDGDLVINPVDMKRMIDLDYEFICGSKIHSDNPIYLNVNNQKVEGFSEEFGNYEWSGICNIKKENIDDEKKYIYQNLAKKLPKKFEEINVWDIDTQNDYYNAEKWVSNNYNTELVIGVLGGMGTYATIEMFRAYAEIFKAEKEWDRPRIIIDNNCTMPSRVRAFLYGEKKELLIEQMSTSIENLIYSGANKVILACNTSHLFLEDIYEKNPRIKDYVINIMECCIEEIRKQNINEVYLLASEGTILSNVYQNIAKEYNIKILTPKENDFNNLRKCIEAVKRNDYSSEIEGLFSELMKRHKYVILGCTELPILYNLYGRKLLNVVFNPLEISLNYLKENFYQK